MRQGDHEIIQSVAEWAESRLLKKAAMSRFGSIDPVGRVPAWTSRRWEHKWSRSREERSAAGSNSSPSTTELDIRGGASKQVRLNLETEVKTNSVRCWIEVSTSWGVSPYIILFRDKHMCVRCIEVLVMFGSEATLDMCVHANFSSKFSRTLPCFCCC